MADSDMWTSVDAGLSRQTGRGLDSWVAAARAMGIGKHKALVDHLKAQGLTHGYANSVALRTFAGDAGSIGEEALMAQMFAGTKAALKADPRPVRRDRRELRRRRRAGAEEGLY